MSYLIGPRITFAGRFQADVSTINNEVRYYHNEKFDSSFQERMPPGSDPEGGWWNPDGSSAFRLVNCLVRGALWGDGTWVTDPAQDPAIGLFVANALGRSAGKMVDLDPQMQMVSAIWGMGIRLTDGTSSTYAAGDFWPASFRDLMVRQPQDAQNQQQVLGAAYTSIVKNLVWDPTPSISSRVLEEIRKLVEHYGPDAALSIRLSLYNYCRIYDPAYPGSQNYTFGNVVGAIGVALPGEPKSFVLGRRFAPTTAPSPPPPPAMSYFDAVVDMASGVVSLDLGNALPLDASGKVRTDQGELSLAVLTVADTVPNGEPLFLPVGQVLSHGDYVSIGDIPYTVPDWLTTTAGIVRLSLPDAARALIADHPLAIVKGVAGDLIRPRTIAARETVMGYLVRADEFVHRLNPQSQVPRAQPIDSTDVAVHAAQWGVPFDSAGISVCQAGASVNLGMGKQRDIDKIPTPIAGWPIDVLSQSTSAFSQGRATMTVTATDPAGARLVYYTPPQLIGDPQEQPALTAPYVDGQIYSLLYSLQETKGWQSPTGQQHFLDSVFIHVRDGYAVNDDPIWNDVAPIFTQYRNLYPVMSKWLVDLGDEQAVTANAALIELAFSLDMNDPNYMPVTRDLSPAKQQTLLAYLCKVQGKQPRPAPTPRVASAPRQPGAPIPVLDRQSATIRAADLKKSQAIKSGGGES